MRLNKFNRIFLCACPKKLKGCDDAELAKAWEILRIRELNVGERVRQAAVAVRFACRFYPVQRFLYCLISERMHMDNEALLVHVHALGDRSEEHTLNSSHVAISYAVFCLKKKK